MNHKLWISTLILLVCLVAAASAATLVTATNPQDAAALVYVSGYDVEPVAFFPYETGTVTVHVVNSANASVALSQPNLIDPHIHVISLDSFTTATNIGPGATMDYSFIITADPPDGTYFPLFTVSTNAFGANAIHFPIKIKVDSTDIRASISTKPDTFSLEKKDMVNVSIINPRLGDISEILIIPQGNGVDVSPAESFVSTLIAGSLINVPFEVTPNQQQPNLTFLVSYRNGDNKHTTSVALPINIGEDKTAAVPVINNIAVTAQGTTYHLTGDVNNAGITDAKSMVLTVNAPARPMGPYPEYAIGSLASDDFSGFELNFAANDLSSVPLQIQWKDAGGNAFSTVKMLDLRELLSGSSTTGTTTGSSSGSGSTAAASGTSAARTGGGPQGGGSILGFGGSRGGGLSSFYPVIAGIVILIVAIVLWMKRKWIAAKLKKK